MQSDYAFACYGSFFASVQKEEKKEMNVFLKAYISRMAGVIYFISCVLSQYAGTCPVNLVLFGHETTKLRTRIKSYFALCVNIRARAIFLGHTTHYPVSW